MISSAFHTLLYEPLYNALVFLTGVIPGADIGLAVVALTLVVRFALLPLSHKQRNTQAKMKLLEADMALIKKNYAADKRVQGEKIMALYREHGVNPLSGFLLILIQIPILLALYFVFTRGIPFGTEDLYSFVSLPQNIDSSFFGLLDLSKANIWAALLVGISQYFQTVLALPPTPTPEKGKENDLGTAFAKSMNTNMKYVMPVIIVLVAAKLPAVVSFYWLTSNLFGIAHELIVRMKAKEIMASPTSNPR
jgi:YidC/Oxa1 family membrane protein insertase